MHAIASAASLADTLVITDRRIYLHCATCQRTTPGWDCRFADQKGHMADAAD